MKGGRIFLIRHGQTAWNKIRYQGWGNPPLDQRGHQQAEALWHTLKDAPIEKVFSSSLLRAVETVSRLVARKQLPMILSDDLRELHYGDLEGEMKKDHPLKVKRDNLHLPVPGGESLFDLYERAVQFISDIETDLLLEKNMLIIGHYWSNRMILGAIRGHSFETVISEPDYRPKNGSILEIYYEAKSEGGIKVFAAHMRAPVADKQNPS